MKKLSLIMLVAASVTSISSFAADKAPVKKAKTTIKCSMGGSCCKKSISKSAMLKAKAAAKKA